MSIPELPGARSHADSYTGAAQEGERLIEEWVEIAHDHGWPLPTPRVHVARA